MATKSVLKSKIVWVNIIPVLLAVLELINPEFLTAMGVPLAKQVKTLAVISLMTGTLTILFRMYSNTALKALVLIAGITTLSGCKVNNELNRHCVVSGNGSVQESEFKVCLECDSVATAIKNIAFDLKKNAPRSK